MKYEHGWYWPDGEKHLIEWVERNGKTVAGRNSYQWKKIAATFAAVRSWHTAIDIGAHVGLWSYYLAQKFNKVHAFEPVDKHRECFAANVDADNVTLHACALGDTECGVRMHVEDWSTGGTYVEGRGDIPCKLLDDFKIPSVDLIKVDLEGMELLALRGAENTIRQWMPTIIVEQKPGHAHRFGLGLKDAIPYLEGLGYKQVAEISGDHIMVPK